MSLLFKKQLFGKMRFSKIYSGSFSVFSTFKTPELKNLRNIGISAHIDSGKTTLTERILFYTGRIKTIHEVRGKDGVGAKMDSMELEREKGITIKSAATFTQWMEHDVNIIDTPGHVDFTVEVERAMRVLDGAVLVVCGASGVQSQTITVNSQMLRYGVARVAFINKLDRIGANVFRTVDLMKRSLKIKVALMQIPIGAESEYKGHIDLMKMRAVYCRGEDGETIVEEPIPPELQSDAEKWRQNLTESVSDVDEELEELFLEEKTPKNEQLKEGIRRATLARKIVPVFIGTAFKNKGVQSLLDGVVDFLPSPDQVENFGYPCKKPAAQEIPKRKKNEQPNDDPVVEKEVEKFRLKADRSKPLLCLAFKLEESKYGQLTWIRIYQGVLKKGGTIVDVKNPRKKKLKVGKIVKMHSEECVEVNQVASGEIAALFGVECDSGTTFGAEGQNILLSDMRVPEPVVSLAVSIINTDKSEKFSKALKRFMREDPTFKVSTDEKTGEIIMSGMGELHLDIYVERLRREYGVKVQTSPPRVTYREAISKLAKFDYTHKKQTGGAGQFARVIGHIEPIADGGKGYPVEFVNELRGLNIPPEYVASIERTFVKRMGKGPLVGGKVNGVRFVIQDGQHHDVDSSDFAFQQATIGALREAMGEAGGMVYEPVMNVEVQAPLKFQSSVVAGLSKRGGLIRDIERLDENLVVRAFVPLEEMFGYSSDLRGSTEGKGEFSMEYERHEQVSAQKQKNLIVSEAKFAAK